MSINFLPIKRDEFFKALETYATLSKTRKHLMALVLVDIENFSVVNQQFSYKTGEHLLLVSHQKLEVLAKFSNCVFRISDSMLALILPILESESLLALAANKIINDLKIETSCGNYQITALPRIGMAALDSENFQAERLFKLAESYLLYAKKTGEDFIINALDQTEEKIENFSERFLDALNKNKFELYYQPKIHLLTRKVHHVEALLRWEIEEGQFVSPEHVIAEAEKSTENNFNLTKWVVNRALHQLSNWKANGLQMGVSVNVSATLIHRSDFVSMVQDALIIWGIDPSLLTVEITETAFMSNTQLCHETLKRLRALGVKLSIDDFGTGYSSLSYFKDIPATELKIDKSFILNLMESSEDRKLVRLMIAIAHSFNLEVVAEGVESKQAYNYLQEAKCDYIQGFYVAKPMEEEKLLGWLNA